MGDVMQNGGYTIMQTIVVIDLSESVVPGIVWRHQILWCGTDCADVAQMGFTIRAFQLSNFL